MSKKTQEIKQAREATFIEVFAATGSPAKAIKVSHPDVYEHSPPNARNRANRLLKRTDIQDKIQGKLEKMHPKALKKINELIMSDDEAIATTNSWRVVEQLRGKPTQRSISLNTTVNIEDALADI